MSKPIKEDIIKVAPFQISGSGRFYHFSANHQLAHHTKLTKPAKKDTEYHNCSNKKWPAFVNLFKSYCESTTLHGLKYLTEIGRPPYERVFWLITILAAYSVVTFVTYDQIEQFLKNPVLISIESTLTSISDIPFPAITFCPDSQILKSTYNLTSAINQPFNSTVKKDENYNYALTMCHLHDYQMFKSYYKKYFQPEFVNNMLNSINGEEHCKKLVSGIFWSGIELKDICKYLQPTVSYFGACFTFNMMPIDQIYRNPNITMKEFWSNKYLGGRENVWSPDTGYKGKSMPTFDCFRNKTPPWISGEGSLITAVSIFLTIPVDSFDESCSSGGKGYFGLVHNPAEIPGSSHPIIYAENNYVLLVTVTPNLHTIDNRLAKWDSKNRGCYFQNERYLKYFKIYTQRNCEIECEANITEKICKCLAFHHPRMQNMQVCGPGLKKCLSSLVGREWSRNSCNCLPSCSELSYQISTARFRRNWRKHVVSRTLSYKHHYTAIYVKYDSRYVSAVRRDLMISLTDFIANVGGLLGLFLGFSFLSVLEVVYFITFRYYSKIKEVK